MKGNVNWQTGHEILKKAATTGPRPKSLPSEYSLPSRDFRLKPGAVAPVARLVMDSVGPVRPRSRSKIPMAKAYRSGARASKEADGRLLHDARVAHCRLSGRPARTATLAQPTKR